MIDEYEILTRLYVMQTVGQCQCTNLLCIINHHKACHRECKQRSLCILLRLSGSRFDISPTDVPKDHLCIWLIGENELGVAFGGIARPGVSTVHPVHEVAIAVPDGKDEDRTALKGAALGIQTAEAQAFGALGVAVFLEFAC